MAYDYFATQQDEDKDKQGGAQQLSSDSSVVTGNGAPSQGAQEAGKPTSSGQFTNLQAYLDANKGTGFGQKAAGDAQKTVDDATSAQDSVDQGFRQKVNQGAVDEDTDLLSKAKSTPQSVDAAAFAKQRDAKYSGPQNLAATDADYMKAYGATDQAKQLGEQTKTEGGRKAWLGDQYGAKSNRYDYTSGMQNLDNLVLQNDPGSQQAFQNVQQNASSAADRFGALKGQLDAYAAQRAGDTDKTRADARGAIGIDDAGNFRDDSDLRQILAQAESQAQQYNQGQTSKNQQILSDFKAGKISPEEYAMLGADASARGYRVDPTQYLRTGAQATRDAVLSPDQQAKIAALSKLAGQDNTYAPNAQLAGTYDPSKANYFDQSGYGAAVQQAKGTYQQQLADLQAKLEDFAKQYAGGSTGMSIEAMNQRNAMVADTIAKKRQLLEDYAGTLGGQKIYDYAPTPVIPSYETQDPNYQQVPYTAIDPRHRM